MSNATDNPRVEVLKAGGSGVFTNYIYKAIPLAFDESMSYYETLAGLRDYLEETVIPTVNNNAEAVAELQGLYEELNAYVDNYFKNLDVQEEINNKLDEMVEDGTLENILTNYVNISKVYTTTNEMLNDNSLVTGQKIKTLGYYSLNDNGSCEFLIEDNEDLTKLQIETINNKYATLIIKDTLNLKQLGCKNESENFDNSTLIQKAINYCSTNNIKLIVDDMYLTSGNEVTNTLYMTGIEKSNKSGLKAIPTISKNYVLKIENNGLKKTTIKNMYINGNKVNTSNTINGVYCTATNYADYYLLIENCTIINCSGDGLYLTGDYSNSTLRECRFYNNEICYNNQNGVYADSLTDSQFFGNTLHSNKKAGLNLYRTGSVRVNNCKAFNNGHSFEELEDLNRIPSSTFSVTADGSPIPNKSYYTRTGNGTWYNPYIFTLFDGAEFENDVTYYELNGIYYKKYSGFYLTNANDTLITNCDIQDNGGDGITLNSISSSSVIRNISISNTKLDNNGLLKVNDNIVSYQSQGLKQLYSGVYCNYGNFLNLDIQANNYRQGSIGYSQYSGAMLNNCDNIILNLNARVQMSPLSINTPSSVKRCILNVNGNPYKLNIDFNDFTFNDFTLVNSGWNSSYCYIENGYVYYDIRLNGTLPTSSSGMINLGQVPNIIKPSIVQNVLYAGIGTNQNRRGLPSACYIDPNADIKFENANNIESGLGYVEMKGYYNL